MAMAVDSAEWLIRDILQCLWKVDEVLSFIGIFYVGKVTVTAAWDVVTGLRIHALSKLRPEYQVGKCGKWAVVAGGSAWVSRGYGEALAQKGMNILLVSDHREAVSIAQEIGESYGVNAEVVTSDINSRPLAGIIKKNLDEKDIGVLVVSPGGERWGCEEGAWECASEGVGAVGLLVRLALPRMAVGGRGRAIVLVCSPPLHCHMPKAATHLYTAVKSFLREYTRALEDEFRTAGITVQVVTPFVPHPHLLASLCGSRISQCVGEALAPKPVQFATAALTTLGHTTCTSGHWTHATLNWVVEQVPGWLAIGGFYLIYKFALSKRI